MNRYEILIGKEPPPDPESTKVREILIGERRAGKTTELVNCIRRSIVKDFSVIVCVFHPNKYIQEMLGPYISRIQLIDKEQFRRGERFFGAEMDAFYYDDIDLHKDMGEISNARNFFEAKEIAVTVDSDGRENIYEYLNACCLTSPRYSFPKKQIIGMTEWDLVGVPRVTSYMRENPVTYKQHYLGEFVNEPIPYLNRERPTY